MNFALVWRINTLLCTHLHNGYQNAEGWHLGFLASPMKGNSFWFRNSKSSHQCWRTPEKFKHRINCNRTYWVIFARYSGGDFVLLVNLVDECSWVFISKNRNDWTLTVDGNYNFLHSQAIGPSDPTLLVVTLSFPFLDPCIPRSDDSVWLMLWVTLFLFDTDTTGRSNLGLKHVTLVET